MMQTKKSIDRAARHKLVYCCVHCSMEKPPTSTREDVRTAAAERTTTDAEDLVMTDSLIFEACVFSLRGLAPMDSYKLKLLIETNGGEVSTNLTPKVT